MPGGASLQDYERLCRQTDPWAAIRERYNLGVALTRGNVEAGRGRRVCLTWENSLGESRTLTYAEIDEASSRLASALSKLGIERGDRVLLRLPNVPEFYVAALGIAKLGAVFIPTSTQFRAAEIAYRLRDSGAVAAVTLAPLAAEIEAARQSAPELKHVISLPYAGTELAAGHLDFWQLVAGGDENFLAADTASDDVAFIVYTSGTTGDPKGVVHLHRYPLSFESLIQYWHDYRDDDVCSCPAEVGWLLPVASTFLYAMRAGIGIVLYHPLDGRFDPATWFRLIAQHKITNFVATPTIYRMLTADPGVHRADLSSLRHGVSAGEPLAPDTIAAVEKAMGFTPLDGIGMSEAMVYCFNMVGFDVAPGSCGRAAPGCEIRLLDDVLNEVPEGHDGILCVRRDTHPGIMKEYWNKPEQTAEVLRGPWYYSGDVLSRDDQGRYWFKGRGDDVIKASGYRISPFEIESTLAEHPAVLEVAAVASPDPVRGSVVKAFITLREGRQGDKALAAELQAWAKERMAPYKYPRQIQFVRELPKTQSGKIKRRLLREQEEARSSGS